MEQDRAVAEILKLGGSVGFDYETDEFGNEVPNAKAPGPAWLHKVLPKGLFASADFVYLCTPQVTDTRLVYLKRLPKLEGLNLDGTQVTDAGLVHLRGLTNLELLVLSNTQITDAGLAHLKDLTNLKDLVLDDTQVTDAGLVHLNGLTGLKVLELNGTHVMDGGLAHLNDLKRLNIFHKTHNPSLNVRNLLSLPTGLAL